MKAQISNDSFRKEKRFSGVYQQQGRMITDADWNELVEIIKQRQAGALDNVVRSGVPKDDGVLSIEESDEGRIATVQAGSLFVNGVHAEVVLKPGTESFYTRQQGFEQPLDLPDEWASPVLYADVWERLVLANEDKDLRDPALHGVDTCVRTQVLAQLKYAPDENVPATLPTRGNARFSLNKPSVNGNGNGDPEVPALQQRLPNCLFRLEVHDVQGDASNPSSVTVKWSSENGAESATRGAEPPQFYLEEYIYEFYSRQTEQHLGLHLQDQGVLRSRLETYENRGSTQAVTFPFVRRWDGKCVFKKDLDGNWFIDPNDFIDAGQFRAPQVQSTFSGQYSFPITVMGSTLILSLELNKQKPGVEGPGATRPFPYTFIVGDYWLARLRGEASDHEQVQILSEQPVGIVHHYLKLAKYDRDNDRYYIEDTDTLRRLSFPPLTDLRADRLQYAPPRSEDSGLWGAFTEGPASPYDTVQKAIDALVHNMGGEKWPITVGYGGRFPTIREAIDELDGQEDLILCLLPKPRSEDGDPTPHPPEHTISQNIVGRRSIYLFGSGQEATEVKVVGSPHFDVTEFKDPAGFAAKLENPQEADAVSIFIKDKPFFTGGSVLLGVRERSGPGPGVLPTTLVGGMNQLLADRSLYEEQRFVHVNLSAKTKKLIELGTQGDHLAELNRSLLEDAFPDDIAKMGPITFEAQEVHLSRIHFHGQGRDSQLVLKADKVTSTHCKFEKTVLEDERLHDWSDVLAASDQSKGRCVALDNDKNVIVAGTFRGTMSFPGSTLNSGENGTRESVFVVKFDADGNHEWSYEFGGDDTDAIEVNRIACDFEGDIVLVGSFKGVVQFKHFDHAGNTLTSCLDPSDSQKYGQFVFVVKIHNDGTLLWTDHLGNSGIPASKTDRGTDVAIIDEANNNIIVAGVFTGDLDLSHLDGPIPNDGLTEDGGPTAFVVKLDKDGKYLSAARVSNELPGSSGMTRWSSCTIDNKGGLIVVRATAGNDSAAVRIDQSELDVSQPLVMSTLVGSGSVRSICACKKESGFYITGYYARYEGSHGGHGLRDTFVSKYVLSNSNMVPAWERKTLGIQDNFATDLAVDGDDHVYVTGGFLGTINLGGEDLISLSRNTGAPAQDAFVANYTTDGHHEWSHAFGLRAAQSYDEGPCVAVTGDGELALTGVFKGRIDLGGGLGRGAPVTKPTAYIGVFRMPEAVTPMVAVEHSDKGSTDISWLNNEMGVIGDELVQPGDLLALTQKTRGVIRDNVIRGDIRLMWDLEEGIEPLRYEAPQQTSAVASTELSRPVGPPSTPIDEDVHRPVGPPSAPLYEDGPGRGNITVSTDTVEEAASGSASLPSAVAGRFDSRRIEGAVAGVATTVPGPSLPLDSGVVGLGVGSLGHGTAGPRIAPLKGQSLLIQGNRLNSIRANVKSMPVNGALSGAVRGYESLTAAQNTFVGSPSYFLASNLVVQGNQFLGKGRNAAITVTNRLSLTDNVSANADAVTIQAKSGGGKRKFKVNDFYVESTNGDSKFEVTTSHVKATSDKILFDGKVGIGTDTPSAKLDVAGNIFAGNSDIYFTKTDHTHTGIGNSDGFAAIENAENYDALMILGRAGTSKGRYVRLWDYLQVNGGLDVTGNVGIGTDTPLYGLHVKASGGFGPENNDGIAEAGNVPIIAQSNSTAFGIINGSGRPAFALNINNDEGATDKRGIPTFYDKYDGTKWHSSISLRNGDVGIGTRNPSERLEIRGINSTAGLRVAWGSQFPYLYGEFKQAGSGGLIVNSNAGGGWANMSLQTDGTTRLFIDANGKVGIGTSQLEAQLEVSGKIKASSLEATGDIYGNRVFRKVFYLDDDPTSSDHTTSAGRWVDLDGWDTSIVLPGDSLIRVVIDVEALSVNRITSEHDPPTKTIIIQLSIDGNIEHLHGESHQGTAWSRGAFTIMKDVVIPAGSHTLRFRWKTQHQTYQAKLTSTRRRIEPV